MDIEEDGKASIIDRRRAESGGLVLGTLFIYLLYFPWSCLVRSCLLILFSIILFTGRLLLKSGQAAS